MIHARLQDASAYRGIHPRLDKALELLTPEYLGTVTTQRRELEGRDLFVTRYEYETVPEAETFFEAHRAYVDIQLLTQGRERVAISPAETLEEFEQHGDFWGYHGENQQCLVLKPGDFLVVFPGEGHRLKIAVDGPEAVSKVVFKIRVKED